jgi:hypothetical protein
MAAPQPTFYRNPGQFVTAGAQFVDWSSDREIKNWKAGTKGLDDKFDLKQSNLMAFLNRVNERAQSYNWKAIIEVPHRVEGQENRQPTNLIKNYGIVTLEECKSHAETYLQQQQRNSQLSSMLYEFLRNSLTMDANKIMDLYTETYTVVGLTDGVCLLK